MCLKIAPCETFEATLGAFVFPPWMEGKLVLNEVYDSRVIDKNVIYGY